MILSIPYIRKTTDSGTSMMDEQEQLSRAQEDPRHFKYFYDKHYRDIFSYIYRRTDNEDLTADLTSQVFLKALQNLHRFEYRGLPFSAWLYRIASNEVIQHFRDSKKERVVSVDERLLGDFCDENEITLDDGSELQALTNAFGKLKADELEMIEMRFFEKRPFKEIGEIKSITENNAKVKVYRIIDKLRQHMSAGRRATL